MIEKKISIITVVRKDLKGLQRTYESIKDDLSEEIEWIVVDGLSDDGTVEFLVSIDSPFIIWISEKDKNMYNAMNKGINLSQGQFLQFLNAGDKLIKSLTKEFTEENQADIIFYNILKCDEKNNILSWSLPLNFLEHLKRYPSVPHQSTFIRKDVFSEVGLYSEDYRYLGDYEFFCRLFKDPSLSLKISYRLHTNLVSFVCNGITFKYRLSLQLKNECISIQKKYFKKSSTKTKIQYWLKYIISYVPGHITVVNKMRYLMP